METRPIYLITITLLLGGNCERWSRQISDSNRLPSEINDWIPLAQPCPTCEAENRLKNARSLNYPHNQLPSHMYSSASQQSLPSISVGQPFQYQRFGFANQKQSLPNFVKQQQPTSQSFFQFEMPAYHGDGSRQHSLPSIQTGYQIHHSGHNRPGSSAPSFSQKPAFPFDFYPQFRPQQQALTAQKSNQQKFIEPIKNPLKERIIEHKPQNVFPPRPTPQQHQFQFQSNTQKPAISFQPQIPFPSQATFQINHEMTPEEEVQLLYVPYNTLYQQNHENFGFHDNKYNSVPPQLNPEQINNFYTSEPVPMSTTTTSTTRPSTSFRPFLHPTFTTPKPKPKSHQPPLAMFMMKSANQPNHQALNEVLTALQSEKSIAVVDSPSTTKTPSVFIGPAGLPTPNGYAKFELPYLSSIDSNHLDRHPFYVAPLSYKLPLGFAKIALPEPHVGSLIVNRPAENFDNSIIQQEIQKLSNFPQQEFKQTYDSQIIDNTIKHQSSTPKVQSHRIPDERNQYPVTYNTVTSPPPKIEQDQLAFQPRPEEHIVPQSPYANFKPIPNHIVNEEYYMARKTPPPNISSTTSFTPITTPTLKESYPTSVDVEIKPSIATSLGTYSEEITRPQQEQYNTETHKIYEPNTQNEENRMKTYFREQEAFKNHPLVQSTTPNSLLETVQYTPVSVDYDNNLLKVRTSTSSYFDISTSRPTQGQRITFYTPSVLTAEEESSAASQTTESETFTTNPPFIPENHQLTYDTIDVKYNQDVKPTENEQYAEYDPNPYQLPSELPPLTPNLPGLVNALIEKERLNALENETTEPLALDTTTTTHQPPYRRPVTRGRRPATKKPQTNEPSQPSSDSVTTRRSIIRGRRPYNPRTNNLTTTTVTPPLRVASRTVVRNPNKIRYSPSPEERQYFRQRTRSKNSSKTNSRKPQKEEDNIEYQRDVLNQNYPVFKSSERTSSETTATTSENINLEQEVVPSPSSHNKDQKETFAGLLEPMQIAQEYQQVPKENYGPGYFPNEETSEAQTIDTKNEVHPIYTTPPTTTTTGHIRTRRPPLIRRTSRPTRTTTPATPITTAATSERYTVRPKSRSDYGTRPRIVKIKGRVRKPHPASTSTQPPDEDTSESSYHKVNRFNQDFYQDDYREENKNDNQKAKFSLDTEESQWSPSLSPSNGFQPLDYDHKAKFLKDSSEIVDEPEIVTAGADFSESNKGDSFLFNVSAGFGSSGGNSEFHQNVDNSTNTSFIDMLHEFMSEIGNNDEGTAQSSLKPELSVSGPNRRRKGVWKRVKINKTETFETAESQNIGEHLVNAILSQNSGKDIQSKRSDTSDSAIVGDYNHTHPTSSNIQAGTDLGLLENHTISPDINIETTSSSEELTTHIEKIPLNLPTVESVTVDRYSTISPETEISTIGSDETNESTELAIQDRDDQIYEEDDLETQPSLFEEIQSQFKARFAVEPTDDISQQFQSHRQKYTNIERTRQRANISGHDIEPKEITSTAASPFHKNLMKSIVYATSTSTEISHETEICYRGRCIKSKKQV